MGHFGVPNSAFMGSARHVEVPVDFIDMIVGSADEPRKPALRPDPSIGDPERRGIGQDPSRAGSRGLIYPSVRVLVPAGHCQIRFAPHSIQRKTGCLFPAARA